MMIPPAGTLSGVAPDGSIIVSSDEEGGEGRGTAKQPAAAAAAGRPGGRRKLPGSMITSQQTGGNRWGDAHLVLLYDVFVALQAGAHFEKSTNLVA